MIIGGDQPDAVPVKVLPETLKVVRIPRQPAQVPHDNHVHRARFDRRQEREQARAGHVVGRFTRVLEDPQYLDVGSVRDGSDGGRLSVEPAPRIRLLRRGHSNVPDRPLGFHEPPDASTT